MRVTRQPRHETGSDPRRPEACSGARSCLAALGATLALALPTTAASQEAAEDSIAVIERGTSGIDGWDVVELPFWIVAAPLYLVGEGVTAVIGVAERGHWLPWLAYYNRQLTDRGIHLSSRGQGPNSGSGAELTLGGRPRERALWADVLGGATVKSYWRAQAQVGFGVPEATRLGGAGVGVRVFGSAEHRAEDEFFGIGRGSQQDDRSDYELDRYRVGGDFAVAPAPGFELRVGGAWERHELGPGGDDRRPDVDSVFAPGEIPGFGERREYLSGRATVAWRVGFPHAIERGGRWASVGYDWNESRTDGAADFGRLTASAGIDLPFDHDIRSVALAIFYESLRPSGAGDVAFHRLPALGGRPLPSYRTERFRDRDLVLGQGEYRFRLWDDPRGRSALDASLFFHAGMVARSMSSEYRFERLRESYGIALSLLDETSRFARLSLALGGERTQLFFTFGFGS